MKLSKRKLNRIIQEEYNRLLKEQDANLDAHLTAADLRRTDSPYPQSVELTPHQIRSLTGHDYRHGWGEDIEEPMSFYNPALIPDSQAEGGGAFHGQSLRQDIPAIHDIGQSNPWISQAAAIKRAGGTDLHGDPIHPGVVWQQGWGRPLQEKLARQIERYIYENLKG